MENIVKKITLVLFVLLFSTISLSSFAWMEAGFNSFIEYNSPKLEVSSTPLISPLEPIDNYVVIFLIDGARADKTLEVAKDGIGALSIAYENGTWFKDVNSLAPTISTPARAAICTGARHEFTGVTTNWWYEHSKANLTISNIFELAKDEGMKTAVVGDESLHQLFGEWLDGWVYWEGMSDWDVTRSTIDLIKENGMPNLLWVSLSKTDQAGHEAGAASAYYAQSIACASVQIESILDLLKEEGVLENTLVIMVSDHGMRNERHHGGTEPSVLEAFLAMMGPKVKRSMLGATVSISQVGPTVSFFFGWELSRLSERLPLIEAFENFENFEERKSIYGINHAELRIKQFEVLIGAFGKGEEFEDDLADLKNELSDAKNLYEVGEHESAFLKAMGIGATISELIDFEFIPMLHGEMMIPRIILVAVLYGTFIFLLYLTSRRVRFTIQRENVYTYVIGVLTFQIVFFSVWFACGYRFSMSSVYYTVVTDHLIYAVIAAFVCGVVTGAFRIGIKMKKDTLTHTLMIILLVMLMNLVILSMYATYSGCLIEFPFSIWNWAMVAFTFLLANTFTGLFGWIAVIPSVLMVRYGLKKGK